MWSDTCSAESPMGKSFESLASYASATFYVLMEVARSVGTTLRAAIATTIFVDQGSDCGAGGIRRNECKTLLRLNGMRQLCIGRALFRVPYKGQLLFARMPIDQKDIPRAHLRGSEQPRNRADYIALDGALQVACSVSLVGALFQQELPSFVRYPKLEVTRRTIQ